MRVPRSYDRGNLVLSRAAGTSFWVGDDIEIIVEGLRAADGKRPLEGMSVVINVRAPRHIPIVRGELKKKDGG